jgi:hypothetical protein
MSNEFQAQRAVLNAELTALALSGADTSKCRDKLTKLDARVQEARDAELAVSAAERTQRNEDAATRGTMLGAAAIARLVDAGFSPTELDADQLAMLGQEAVRFDADIEAAEDVRAVAFAEVERISDRIEVLKAHSAALTDLRLTGQGTPRDLSEFIAVERDIETLQAALGQANARASTVKLPNDVIQRRQRALEALDVHTASIVTRCLRERIQAAEHAYLDSVRALLAATGARATAGTYVRGQEFDRFVRYGAL